jgi:hypothetical protein
MEFISTNGKTTQRKIKMKKLFNLYLTNYGQKNVQK